MAYYWFIVSPTIPIYKEQERKERNSYSTKNNCKKEKNTQILRSVKYEQIYNNTGNIIVIGSVLGKYFSRRV